MLYPTAGSRFYIADAPTETAGAFPSTGWTEIGSTEALGSLGVKSELLDVTTVVCGEVDPSVMYMKGVQRRSPMPVILGMDPTDAGQVLLRKALADQRNAYPFRLVLPDGTTTRHWWALVFSLSEVFDTANALMKLQIELQPTSPITRSEAEP